MYIPCFPTPTYQRLATIKLILRMFENLILIMMKMIVENVTEAGVHLLKEGSVIFYLLNTV